MSDTFQELEDQISTVADLKEKIDLMNRLAVELSQQSERNLPQAVALCESALELAQGGESDGEPYPQGLIDSLKNLGTFYLRLSRYDLALSFLQRAQALLKMNANPAAHAAIHATLGLTHNLLGDFASALNSYNQALEIYRALNQVEEQAGVLLNLSRAYLGRGEAETAMEYLNQSLELARQAGLKTSQAAALTQIARVYFSRGSYNQARKCAQQACHLYHEAENAAGEAEAQVVLGDISLTQKKPERAVDCYQAALAAAQQSAHQKLAVEALLRLGGIYRDKGEADKALPFITQACALAEEIGQKAALCESHQALAAVYRQRGDFEKALEHFEQFYAIKEQLMIQEMENCRRNQEMFYQAESARKEAEIYQLRNVILQEEIRQRQEMEKTLTQVNRRLMDEVALREQLIDDLNAFSSMVAHDLKNPLTNIALTAGVLRMSVTLANDKVGQEAADRLYHQVEKINRIINELLVLASVQKGDIFSEPLDMGAIITEVEARLERLIKEHRPEIRKPASWPVARGHAPWVEEVWENYISNAIHYGGRPPIVEIGADEQPDGMIRFWVRDNGRGLTQEVRERLFTSFQRNNYSRPSGHGLGLSIVKRIVEKLGGEVGAESEGLGEGSLFYFTLPAARIG